MVCDAGPGNEGGFLVGSVDIEKAVENWEDIAKDSSIKRNLLIGLTFSAVSVFDDKAPLSEMGLSYIAPPSGTLRDGAVFPLKLVQSASNKPASVSWYCDEAPVKGESVTLRTGSHTIQAHLKYANGARDIVELRVEVK